MGMRGYWWGRHLWWVSISSLAPLLLVCPRVQGQTKKMTQGLQITSPAREAIVHPGDTITVKVSPLRGVNATFVFLITEYPLHVTACASQPCYKFTLTVPAKITRAGSYTLVALGADGASGRVYSPVISLDVEPSATITRMQLDSNLIVFHRVGESVPLIVTGVFANGTSMDITESTRIIYMSSNTKVATVTQYGMVTAVGTGCTHCAGIAMIKVSFGGRMDLVQVSTSDLKHTVPPPS